jgi:hypothetical protein
MGQESSRQNVGRARIGEQLAEACLPVLIDLDRCMQLLDSHVILDAQQEHPALLDTVLGLDLGRGFSR